MEIMAILSPIMLCLVIVGTIRYNKLRQNWAHVMGVPGSYVIFLGIIMFVGLIGTVISLIAGNHPDTSEVVPGIIVVVLCLGYMAYLMLTKCRSTKERILLPVVACLIGAGFCWRLIGAIVFHTPMSNGKPADEFDLNRMPNIIYDDSNNRWQLQHRNYDTVVYHNDNGQEVTIYSGQVSEHGALTDAGSFHW